MTERSEVKRLFIDVDKMPYLPSWGVRCLDKWGGPHATSTRTANVKRADVESSTSPAGVYYKAIRNQTTVCPVRENAIPKRTLDLIMVAATFGMSSGAPLAFSGKG